MRILADENVERAIVLALRDQRHAVAYVAELSPGLQDALVLQAAAENGALLLTWDKDFRHLVFTARRPCAGVLLLRLMDRPTRDKIAPVLAVIAAHGERLHRAFSTLTSAGLRMEPLPGESA